MNNLYDTPLKRINGGHGYDSSCLYKMDEANTNYYHIGACHSGVRHKKEFNPKDKKEFFIYIRKDRIVYSLEDLKRWLRFIRYCGFKFHFLQEELISIGDNKNRYEPPFKGEVYTLKLKCEEYINNMHVFAALTAMRYVYYDWNDLYRNIPEAVFILKKEFKGKLDGIQALLLAFLCVGLNDYSHSFSGQDPRDNIKGSIMMTKKIFYNRINTNHFNELNTLLFNPTTKNIHTIRGLYEAQDFKALGEFLFKK